MQGIKQLCFWLGLSALIFAQPANALSVDDVRVVGLSKNMAVLSVNGKQRLMKVGKTSPEGITLLSATSKVAEVEISGQTYQLSLQRQHSGGYQKPSQQQVVISINDIGQYKTNGSINGQSVEFLVDTGANAVAINSQDARRLGIDFTKGVPGQASTAGGMVRSYTVILDRVKVGGISVSNVRAFIVEGAFPQDILLGMTFLSQVRMVEEAGLLTLTQKF